MRSAAKAYLQRVRELDAAQRSSDEDEDEGEGGDRHAQLSERLRREALEVTYCTVDRPISVEITARGKSMEGIQGDGRLLRPAALSSGDD